MSRRGVIVSNVAAALMAAAIVAGAFLLIGESERENDQLHSAAILSESSDPAGAAGRSGHGRPRAAELC